MSIGEVVKQKRLARRWSQDKLAKQADLTTKTISRLENGVGQPAPITLAALEKALELPENTLSGLIKTQAENNENL